MRLPHRSLIGAAALVIVVAACGDDDSSPAEAPAAAPTPPPTTLAATPPVTEAPPVDATTPPTSPPVTVTTIAPATTTAPPPGTTTTTEVPPTTEPGPFLIKIDVYDGVATGEGHITVERGTEIELVVTADVADEIHVHGYDYKADVTPQRAATIIFVADLPGIYEVELEDARLVLFELEVR